MKKLLLGVSSLALAGVFTFSGCSCSKTGTYKFQKLEMKVGSETKTYTCTIEEKENNLEVATACAMYEKTSIELTKNEMKRLVDGEEASKVKYKIEKKKLYTRENDEDEWKEIGTYKSGTIIETRPEITNLTSEIKVYLKK